MQAFFSVHIKTGGRGETRMPELLTCHLVWHPAIPNVRGVMVLAHGAAMSTGLFRPGRSLVSRRFLRPGFGVNSTEPILWETRPRRKLTHPPIAQRCCTLRR